MPKMKYVNYTIVFLIILISIVISRNLIFTGSITGEQIIYKIGVLKSTNERFSIRNDRVEQGINLASLPSPFESFRIENIIKNNSNFNSSLEDFRNSYVKAFFLVDVDDIFRILEMENYDMLIFSLTSAFSFSEPIGSLFFLRDQFLMPGLIIADSMRNYGVKKAGIVYVRSPLKTNHSWDYSDEIFKSVFNNVVGEIAFSTTFYVENRSNSTEILNLIDSTETEAIAFLGYGTFYEEFSELLSEIKGNTTGDMKIYSIGWGSKMTVFDFPETFHDVHLVKIDYNTTTGRIIGIPYPFRVEGQIFIEILKNLFQICGDDITCIKGKIHENTFDTVIGKVKFRENGVIIRPYLLNKIDVNGTTRVKRYTLDDIEKIISDYNLDFLN